MVENVVVAVGMASPSLSVQACCLVRLALFQNAYVLQLKQLFSACYTFRNELFKETLQTTVLVNLLTTSIAHAIVQILNLLKFSTFLLRFFQQSVLVN